MEFSVTGMSCAACANRIEKTVGKISGVSDVSVNFLTKSMIVSGTFNSEAVISSVKNAGYGAKIKKNDESSEKNEIHEIRKRLILSLIFAIPIFFVKNTCFGVIQGFFSLIVLIIYRKFFINGFNAFFHHSSNMDTLVSLGSGVSFLWSCYSVSMNIINSEQKPLYFESAAMILVLISFGKLLEAFSKGKTTDALKSLLSYAPEKALVLQNDTEIEIDADCLKNGDIFILKPGMKVPCDGIIIEGVSDFDEAMITGESLPVFKVKSSLVTGGTINLTGFVKCKATAVNEDTVFSKIVELVENTINSKAPVQRISDRVSGFFVPIVLVISSMTFVIWIFLNRNFDFAFARAVSVLVISCPCALGLATPVAVMVGNGIAFKNGIFFKNARSLENAGKIKTVVLDKTGTVTNGNLKVVDFFTKYENEKEKLFSLSYLLESKSSHLIGKAITDFCKKNQRTSTQSDWSIKPVGTNIDNTVIQSFEEIPGHGVKCTVNGDVYKIGNFTGENIKINDSYKLKAEEEQKKGRTVVYFEKNDVVCGIFILQDEIKEDSKSAIKKLKALGLQVILVSGDEDHAVKTIAENICVNKSFGKVMPEGKAVIIKELQKNGKVCMVGDGINDAPALVKSDLGIAIGNGTDVALQSADVVIIKNSLMDVYNAILIGRKTLKNIHENLFWAFLYNIACIPLAAGVFTALMKWNMNPMISAMTMSLSSFCVVTNALRLNLLKLVPVKVSNNLSKHNIYKENIEMTKSLKVEGMMCNHCEKHVKNALEKIDGVVSASPDYKTGNVIIELSKEIDNSILIDAIEKEDYKVIQ